MRRKAFLGFPAERRADVDNVIDHGGLGILSALRRYGHRDGTLVGTDSSAPYTYSYSNASAGRHNFYASATDDQGATGTSEIFSLYSLGVMTQPRLRWLIRTRSEARK